MSAHGLQTVITHILRHTAVTVSCDSAEGDGAVESNYEDITNKQWLPVESSSQ